MLVCMLILLALSVVHVTFSSLHYIYVQKKEKQQQHEIKNEGKLKDMLKHDTIPASVASD